MLNEVISSELSASEIIKWSDYEKIIASDVTAVEVIESKVVQVEKI